ncbi:MAG: short-chain dehydrogenase/reductase [Firmicutes bacterium]|nr:short-chain dehydrogenase/reductase [Bacillota bacterium]
MDLKGQVAIVTGAGQGMGRGIAEKLSLDGAKVLVVDKNEEGACETAQMLIAAGGEAAAIKADISIVSDIKMIFEKCREYFGRTDILVANASLSYASPLLETSEEEYYKVFDINAKGTLFCLREAGWHLNDGGRIVVISSSTTRYPNKGMILYSATKAAQKLMVEVAALELAERGITVNSVMPGVTETPAMLEGLPLEFQQQIIQKSPFKRLGKPQDIAEVVAFLCSKNSQWISGQHILANGGGAI